MVFYFQNKGGRYSIVCEKTGHVFDLRAAPGFPKSGWDLIMYGASIPIRAKLNFKSLSFSYHATLNGEPIAIRPGGCFSSVFDIAYGSLSYTVYMHPSNRNSIFKEEVQIGYFEKEYDNLSVVINHDEPVALMLCIAAAIGCKWDNNGSINLGRLVPNQKRPFDRYWVPTTK